MKSFSKSSRIFAAIICFVSITTMRVHGQGFLVTVDENGNGTISNQPLQFIIGTDPCPGGFTNALIYSLPFPGTPGDVVLKETGATSTNVSDLIRFPGNYTLIFYSDVHPSDPADSLADVGLPTEFCNTNHVFLQEIGTEASNGCVYAPSPGQPGFDPSYQPTYNFISDVPPSVNIRLDENGNGFTNGLPVTGVLTNDPGPGGQANALTYPLPFPGVVGDVLIMESLTGGEPSDLLRFNGNGTVVFYSDTNANDIADSPADTGMPGFFYTANFTNILEVGTEGSNGCVYVPSPGQPGYDPSNPIYNIISDVPAQTNTVTIDENGNGTVNTQPLSHSFQFDPGPCGVPTLNVLTYQLPTPYVGTTGDVVLLEPQTGLPSDLIRFNGNGTVVFYSELPETNEFPDLADVGLPCAYYPNLWIVYEMGAEGSNSYAYTPVPGGPGWDPNYPVTFNFISDVPPSITIDEDGKGSINGLPITGVLTNDPGPGGQSQALTYNLPFAGTPGDVLIYDDDTQTNVQDIIRFNGNGTVVFYSDPFLLSTNAADSCESLADGPGPAVYYSQPPPVMIPEVGAAGATNSASYTPSPGQPGYDPSGPTYTFISDYPPLAADPFAAWQLKYFGCTNCAQAAEDADPDGDGMSNLNEFLAGTVPTNSLSSLRITSITRVNTIDINIVWTAVGCKAYFVQVTPGTVADGSYTNNFADIPGSLTFDTGKGEGTLNYLDVGAATNNPSRYYRVRLVQ